MMSLDNEYYPPFERLHLPLGAYQHIDVRPVGSETREVFDSSGAYPHPAYYVTVTAAVREQFKLEETLMLLDREALTRIQRLTTLLKNPRNVPVTYDDMFRAVKYFQISR